jgi:dTMP kinase
VGSRAHGIISDDWDLTGYFITLEGGEGVGKSTQIRALADALRGRGVDLVVTREPGGSEGAEAIRALLMQGDADRWNDRTEALLFAAARADHVAKTILPALQRGAWVLCDRYVDSTRAYQGGGGGLTDADIMALHQLGSGGLLPHRTFLLRLDADMAHKRLSLRDIHGADRMGSKPADYQNRLAARFLELAEAEPERWRVVDADASPEKITQRLIDGLAEWLP